MTKDMVLGEWVAWVVAIANRLLIRANDTGQGLTGAHHEAAESTREWKNGASIELGGKQERRQAFSSLGRLRTV